jgi:hypothetical protein
VEVKQLQVRIERLNGILWPEDWNSDVVLRAAS